MDQEVKQFSRNSVQLGVRVVKDNGVTVITLATDRKSMLPPLCQIFKTLCYSPMCCSVNGGMTRISSMATVGAIQIMVGLFSIGLGPGRISMHPEDFADLGAAYWLGGVFILAGVVSVLGSLYPSVRLVGFSALMNIVSSIVSIAGVVLYAIDLGEVSFYRMCDRYNNRGNDYDDGQCRYVESFFQRLLISMDVTMIVLTVLQLSVSICFTVLPIRALISRMKKEQVGKDVEDQHPEMKKPLLTSPGA